MSASSWTFEELEHAVASSRCLTDVLRQLGLRVAGANFASIGGWIERLGLSTSHFDPDACRGRPKPAIPLAEILVEHSRDKRARLKDRRYADGLKERRCELCGQGELWQGRWMTLILDHINGVHDDNRIDNLRIVCANCAATLETHCGRNSRLGPRSCELCGVQYHPRLSSQRYCSTTCGSRAPKPFRGRPCPERRKVERPAYELLVEQVKTHGFLATGRMHGVSDNAVRKWIVWSEREQEAQARSADHTHQRPP